MYIFKNINKKIKIHKNFNQFRTQSFRNIYAWLLSLNNLLKRYLLQWKSCSVISINDFPFISVGNWHVAANWLASPDSWLFFSTFTSHNISQSHVNKLLSSRLENKLNFNLKNIELKIRNIGIILQKYCKLTNVLVILTNQMYLEEFFLSCYYVKTYF